MTRSHSVASVLEAETRTIRLCLSREVPLTPHKGFLFDGVVNDDPPGRFLWQLVILEVGRAASFNQEMRVRDYYRAHPDAIPAPPSGLRGADDAPTDLRALLATIPQQEVAWQAMMSLVVSQNPVLARGWRPEWGAAPALSRTQRERRALKNAPRAVNRRVDS
jgi:hypothetical protein